jgi:hypothetical protein
MRITHVVTGVCGFLMCACVATAQEQPRKPASSTHASATDVQTALHVVQQDLAIAELLQSLRKQASYGLVAFRNVRVIDPVSETVLSNQSVIVGEDRIVWTGDRAKEPAEAKDAKAIDGQGRYLSPGLTDMHVHSSSAGSWLLDLSNGVTAVRDMAGFPWMLRAREKINAGEMLAPTLFVAGPLINASPLGGYAVVPKSPLDARRSVRQQAACGYDFIKVHNIVPEPIFDAVAEQARAEGMELVGHVPHDIPVQHAVQSGMRTMEHLKGFINDQTLKQGETNYLAAASNNVWNTPTLYAGRAYARGAEAESYLSSPELQYVPMRRRERWKQLLAQQETPVQKSASEARVLARRIVHELYAVHAHFLAGTDTDNFPFQVSGFALVEELRLLQEAGLSPGEALRSATTEPAKAMREPTEFGQIREGMRADLIMLENNPLSDVAAFRQNRGVMVHGFWLEREKLFAALAKLAQAYAELDENTEVTESAIRSAAGKAESLNRDGFVFNSNELTRLAQNLRKAGYARYADRFDALADVPRVGPCAELRP